MCRGFAGYLSEAQLNKFKPINNKNEFDASLVVNKETHKIDFEFAKQDPITPPRGGYYPDDAELEYYEPVIPEEMK